MGFHNDLTRVYCLSSNGCGLDIGVKNGRVIGVRGRVTDRVNKGRLGPKGLNGLVRTCAPCLMQLLMIPLLI